MDNNNKESFNRDEMDNLFRELADQDEDDFLKEYYQFINLGDFKNNKDDEKIFNKNNNDESSYKKR